MAANQLDAESTAKPLAYPPPRRHPGLSDELGFTAKRPSFKQVPGQDRE